MSYVPRLEVSLGYTICYLFHLLVAAVMVETATSIEGRGRCRIGT